MLILTLAGCLLQAPEPDDSGTDVDTTPAGPVETIGAAGGRVTLDDVTLEIPRGALQETVEITIANSTFSDLGDVLSTDDGPATVRAIELLPAGQTFSEPVTLTIDESVPDGQTRIVLWERVEGGRFEPPAEDGEGRYNNTHFSQILLLQARIPDEDEAEDIADFSSNTSSAAKRANWGWLHHIYRQTDDGMNGLNQYLNSSPMAMATACALDNRPGSSTGLGTGGLGQPACMFKSQDPGVINSDYSTARFACTDIRAQLPTDYVPGTSTEWPDCEPIPVCDSATRADGFWDLGALLGTCPQLSRSIRSALSFRDSKPPACPDGDGGRWTPLGDQDRTDSSIADEYMSELDAGYYTQDGLEQPGCIPCGSNDGVCCPAPPPPGDVNHLPCDSQLYCSNSGGPVPLCVDQDSL